MVSQNPIEPDATNVLEWSNLMNDILEIANAPDTNEGALTQLVTEIGSLFAANGGAIYLYNATREIKHEVSYGLSNQLTRQIEAIGQSQANRRLLTAQNSPYIVEDVSSAAQIDAGRAPILELLEEEGIVSVAAFPLVAAGNLLGFLALYHRARHAYSEEEIRSLSLVAGMLGMAMLNRRLADSRKVEDKGRDHFISALSHELRTPLTSIIGFTQMVRRKLARGDPQSDGRIAEHMEIIWAQAQRLNRLIDTFVDIANIEQGDFTIKFGRVEVVSVLKSAVEHTVARLAPACKVEVEVPDGLVWAQGDTQRLEQVFSHVISNALRYSPAESPVVIRCVEHGPEGQVEVSVTDQGPGMSADLRGAIFTRFYQSDALRAGGLGVGLYLSKTIVEAHGGQIGVESSPSDGTTVSITLPV